MMTDSTSVLKEAQTRSRFFQSIQNWPLNDNLNYDGWLNNFDSSEKIIACHILNFFSYYPVRMIDKMLGVSVGNAGYLLRDKFPSWSYDDFKKNCIYSFIPGETKSPTDSGNFFARKLRDALKIKEDNIIDYDKIGRIASPNQPIILVDDFVGSGAQVYKAWNQNYIPIVNKTLSDLATKNSITFIYCPLIVNWSGYNVIKTKCIGLGLSSCHILTKEYNLFDPSCYCWKGDKDLYRKGTELIINKSKDLGIPFSNGKDVRDVRGYQEQGLALSFEHGAPDAIPSFFYWDQSGWTPLIRKNYER